MKKILTLLSIFSLVIANPFNSVSETQDNKSNEILNKLSKTYKTYKSVKASFTVTIYNKKSNTKVRQTGQLYQKGKKFRVNMSGQEIYCDGKTIWTYIDGANEVQVSKFDAKSMDINPSEIFTIYEKGFVHKYGGQKVVGTKTLDIVELIPTDKSKGYFKVKLGIDKLANKVKEMVVYSKNGLETTYDINKLDANVPINDSYFKFNTKDKPGVIVIDLR
ncbi:MAG: outer membrane lipoprotein carrier protein LolA [Bacteroidia bacterium]|jgi:outer membrane lipoprotein-sorting protein|tara:strand:+ start:552 stop:1208 length:657 start_codon:yes stop_codon:yes gene_type:complete